MAESRMERTTRSFPFRECWAITLIFASVFIALALFSYAPVEDTSTGSLLGTNNTNLVGTSGLTVALVLGEILGWVAFCLPILIVLLGVQVVLPKTIDWDWLRVGVSICAFLIVLLASCTLVQLHVTAIFGDFIDSGGWLGALAAKNTLDLLGTTGLTLISITFVLIGTQLFFFFSWSSIFRFVRKSAEVIGKYGWMAAKRASDLLLKFLLAIWNFLKKFTLKVASLKEDASRGERPIHRRNRPSISIREQHTQRSSSVSSNALSYEPDEVRSTLSPVRIKQKQPASSEQSLNHENEDSKTPIKIERHYSQPSLDLLHDAPINIQGEEARSSELRALGERLQENLADFGVEAKVETIVPGPVVTRFELDLAAGVKSQKILSLVKDLARALAVPSVRVVPVIPGKTVVGVEIPNTIRKVVTFKEVMEDGHLNANRGPLSFALGANIAGEPVCADIEKMPHLLVAGTTGSGKSVGLNVMLLSLLFRVPPEELRLVLIDPKMLELSVYENIPHLLTPVVTDMEDASKVLNWCVAEMERRYRLLAQVHVRTLSSYNSKVEAAEAAGTPIFLESDEELDLGQPEVLVSMPRILVVVDELADLIMMVGKKVEELIVRIAQKARAAGIHLVLATQRPSTDVITGLIKSNIPCRMSFQVSSSTDSRVILDQGGAEQLLGQGDMLYLPPGSSVPERIHGAFVSDDEVLAVVQDLVSNSEVNYNEEVLLETVARVDSVFADTHDSETDERYDDAVAFVLESNKATISSLQRKLRIGYNRAANLIEKMEENGVVSEPDVNNTRRILLQRSA